MHCYKSQVNRDDEIGSHSDRGNSIEYKLNSAKAVKAVYLIKCIQL
jgi:hypothetical protein